VSSSSSSSISSGDGDGGGGGGTCMGSKRGLDVGCMMLLLYEEGHNQLNNVVPSLTNSILPSLWFAHRSSSIPPSFLQACGKIICHLCSKKGLPVPGLLGAHRVSTTTTITTTAIIWCLVWHPPHGLSCIMIKFMPHRMSEGS